MPTTPNFALPFPLDTDPADVPADMEELADAVDSALGQVGTASVPQSLVDAKGDLLVGSAPDTVARVPVGTNGYVLAADSPSPAGVKWIQLAGAYVAVADKGVPNGVASLDATGKVPSAQLPTIPPSGIQPTIIDAKGDLIAGAANDTPQRFAVGADGQALVADSTQPQGLKWATPSGGGGGGIDPAIFDAKGDVLIASAPDTPARLAVGANGQVLTADPSAANGLRYGERIDYENVYSAGTAYQPGDVVTYNGVTYLCVNPATGQTPPAVTGGGGASVQVVTTLPASPTDGLEVILVDSLTLPTYAWHLKYQAGIIDANKWVYVGGSPLEHDITAAEVTNSATYVDLATVGRKSPCRAPVSTSSTLQSALVTSVFRPPPGCNVSPP